MHVLAERGGHWNRSSLAVDADEDELRAGDERVVLHSAGGLPHGKAGPAVVGEGLLEAEDVPRERGGAVVDHCLT